MALITPFLLFGTIGFPELLIILFILLLLFGTTRLPQLGRALGETIKSFKEGMKAGEEEKPSLKCPKCGYEAQEDATFCQKCGEKLK